MPAFSNMVDKRNSAGGIYFRFIAEFCRASGHFRVRGHHSYIPGIGARGAYRS
jgi:hypothetical protein